MVLVIITTVLISAWCLGKVKMDQTKQGHMTYHVDDLDQQPSYSTTLVKAFGCIQVDH